MYLLFYCDGLTQNKYVYIYIYIYVNIILGVPAALLRRARFSRSAPRPRVAVVHLILRRKNERQTHMWARHGCVYFYVNTR